MVARHKSLPPPVKPQVTFDDFQKIDVRIGKVVTAQKEPKSERLIRLEVDFGGEIGIRTIFAGVALWYNAEDFVGRKFMIIINLEPKAMMGSFSDGMMLAADDGERARLLPIEDSLPVGAVVR